MHPLEWIAERRTDEAVSRGELDRLPNAGAPLDLYGPWNYSRSEPTEESHAGQKYHLKEVFHGIYTLFYPEPEYAHEYSRLYPWP